MCSFRNAVNNGYAETEVAQSGGSGVFTMLIHGVLQNNLDDFGSDDDDKRRKAWLKLGSESGSILLAGMPRGRDLPRQLFEDGIPRCPVTDLLRVGSDP